jgi:cytoskeletal protein CcmA (bactofilin family)
MDSLLGGDLTIRGTVETAGDVQILGTVDGPVTARGIAIEPGGTVTGNLAAERVVIDGTTIGDIDASQIDVGSNGRIEGQIRCRSLRAAAGARIQAFCKVRIGTPSAHANAAPAGAPRRSAGRWLPIRSIIAKLS